MNATRRRELSKIYDAIEELRSQIETLREDEQDAFDNMPEPFQYTERGSKMESYIDQMDNACDSLQEAMEYIEEITNDN